MLDAKIVGNYQRCVGRFGRTGGGFGFAGRHGCPLNAGAVHPVVGLLASHFAHQVATIQPFPVLRQGQQFFGAFRAVGAEGGVEDTLVTQAAGERTGIHLANAGDAVAFEIALERFVGAPVGDHRADLTHNKGSHLWAVALYIFGVDAGVAHMGYGHADHLAAIGGIGDHLLIAGEAGIKDYFTDNGGGSPKGHPFIDSAIG